MLKILSLWLLTISPVFAAAKITAPGNQLVKQVSRLKFEVSRSAAEKEDAMAQLATFTALPSFAGGPFSGLRVSGFSAKCLLPKFGIQDGDVITSVNGINVRMPSDVVEIGEKLAKSHAGSKVRVQIQRGDDEVIQNYLVVD